jgi:AraC family transcriptional regulator
VPLSDGRSYVRGGETCWLATRLYRELQEPDPLSSLVIEGLVLEILAQGAREARRSSGSAPPRWLRQVTDLIHMRFHEPLTLVELAQAASVHPAHLARVFRRSFACSIGAYVRRLRVDHAARELSRTEVPLTEIALACGFFDQSHFSTVFKRHTGLSPAEYRKVCRG